MVMIENTLPCHCLLLYKFNIKLIWPKRPLQRYQNLKKFIEGFLKLGKKIFVSKNASMHSKSIFPKDSKQIRSVKNLLMFQKLCTNDKWFKTSCKRSFLNLKLNKHLPPGRPKDRGVSVDTYGGSYTACKSLSSFLRCPKQNDENQN